MKAISKIVIVWLFFSPFSAFSQNDIVGEIKTYVTSKKNEDIQDISRKFDVGWVEMVAANPSIRAGKIPRGTHLMIPSAHILPAGAREGIVVNLSGMRLFYFAPGGSISTHPISIGKEGWATPIGETEVVDKRKDPVWRPPASIRKEDPSLPLIVPAGPENPLGKYALALDHDGVMIHGTTSPRSIGKQRSHGCIRMYPEDIEKLFNQVSVGTPVTIIDTPFKLGFQDKVLYLEVTPTQEQAMAIQAGKKKPATDEAAVHLAIGDLAKVQNIKIDWYTVDKAIQNADGIPTIIGYLSR
jgi:L,D-transpeptidase ErfK/SrfK